jgi:hypothetical protein
MRALRHALYRGEVVKIWDLAGHVADCFDLLVCLGL